MGEGNVEPDGGIVSVVFGMVCGPGTWAKAAEQRNSTATNSQWKAWRFMGRNHNKPCRIEIDHL
jgi:hypothetical protein